MLIAPVRKRKERLSCLNISEPNVAAWPEPMPWRNEHRGSEIEAARDDFRNCFLVSFIFFKGEIDCFGRVDDGFFRETIKADEPKRPVKRGRRGSLIGRLKVRIPRKPARRKIVSERRKFLS